MLVRIAKQEHTCSKWLPEWHHSLLSVKAQADSLRTETNSYSLALQKKPNPLRKFTLWKISLLGLTALTKATIKS